MRYGHGIDAIVNSGGRYLGGMWHRPESLAQLMWYITDARYPIAYADASDQPGYNGVRLLHLTVAILFGHWYGDQSTHSWGNWL